MDFPKESYDYYKRYPYEYQHSLTITHMEQLLNTQILERMGLAGALMASIWVNYKLVIGFNKTMSNHITHSTESSIKLTNAVNRLIKFLEKKIK